MNNVPTMLTIKETAKQTNVAEYYVRKLIWENKIVYVKAGSKYLVNFDKFVDFLNEGMNGSLEQPKQPKDYGVLRKVEV